MALQCPSTHQMKVFMLASGILLFGTVNTVFAKYQNKQSFLCLNDTYDCDLCPEDLINDTCIDFEQPFFQAFFTFAGETICLFLFVINYAFRKWDSNKTGIPMEVSKLKGWSYFIFIIPAGFDVVGTSMMNLGLVYTNASVYQMLRGVVVVFTGFFTVCFLKKKQYAFQWVGITLVVLGVFVVGLVSVVMNDTSIEPAKNPLLGDILVIVAQMFISMQLISEEKFLGQFNAHPLQVVGFEGVYGMGIIISLLCILQTTLGDSQPTGNIYDVKFALALFSDFLRIQIPSICFILSYCMTNFFGVWTTQTLGATARTTIEQCRTLTVWFVGLALGWESFLWPQIIGFVVLVIGAFIYNKAFRLPYFQYPMIDPYAEKSQNGINGKITDDHDFNGYKPLMDDSEKSLLGPCEPSFDTNNGNSERERLLSQGSCLGFPIRN